MEGPDGRPRLVSAGPVGTWVSAVIGACWLDGTSVLLLDWLGPGGSFPDLSAERDLITADGDMLGWVLITPDGRATVHTIQNTCDPNDPGPQPPPDPISIWEQTPLPDPEVLTSPRVRGLVGVPNHFWYEGPDSISVDPIVVNGWTVETEARLDHVDWELGNGTTVTATSRRSAREPRLPRRDGDLSRRRRLRHHGAGDLDRRVDHHRVRPELHHDDRFGDHQHDAPLRGARAPSGRRLRHLRGRLTPSDPTHPPGFW